VNFHLHQQTVSYSESETGEIFQTSLSHNVEPVRRFYEQFKGAVVGIEASGMASWFEQLMQILGYRLLDGNPHLIRARARSRHKFDRRDADLFLDLLLKYEFPALWRELPKANR
jgi:transposase